MEETYTFSRALHLMRYSGKKMRSTVSDHIIWINNRFIMSQTVEGVALCYALTHDEIMGSWVEVRS